jgi:hypothetical protein
MRKQGEFSFEWLFAIVAGAAILILAVYGAIKIGDSMRYQTDTETAKQISILTDPMQAGFASSSAGKIIFNQETKINNLCTASGFGDNRISVSSKSGVGEEWVPSGAEISISNKYIFSSPEIGKEYYVFSKPFFFPYKVADLIFITSKDYCFVDAPDAMQDELRGFNAKNIKIGNCTDEIKVCFSGTCDIKIVSSDLETGYVEKDGMKMDFAGSLLYGAIFSDKGVYDCNVKRLMYRAGSIAEVYYSKADLMNSRGCDTNLQPDLMFLSSLKNSSISSLTSNYNIAKEIDRKNEIELCRLW